MNVEFTSICRSDALRTAVAFGAQHAQSFCHPFGLICVALKHCLDMTLIDFY